MKTLPVVIDILLIFNLFQLENYLENSMKCRMMPRTPMILKPVVVPHKFACQGRMENIVQRKPNKLSTTWEKREVCAISIARK